MLDVTKQVWEMLLKNEPTEKILKICSVSTLSKVRAEFNRQRASGRLMMEPGRFPQKPRGKSAISDNVMPLLQTGYILPKETVSQMKEKFNLYADNPMEKFKQGGSFGMPIPTLAPPANYPQYGKPDIKTEENFDKGEKVIEIKSYEIKTLQQLIEWTETDMTKFECVSFTANRWGNERWECTQCKAIFRPIVKKGVSPEEAAEIFAKMTYDYVPPVYMPLSYEKKVLKSGNIAESVAMDVHYGSLTLARETGTDYNMEIAAETLLESTRFHLDFISNFNPEKIIMPVGSDFFNVDTVNNTTTNGTFQSEDSTWKHTFDAGCRLIVSCIDLHKQIAPVEVLMIVGNHDNQRTFSLGAFLSAWYRHDPFVKINNEPTIRKYFTWGTTLIGISHGEERKGTNYLGLMNIEAREACGKAVYKEFHLGHKHHLDIKEDLGFRVRGLGGLTATDEWHSKMGYGALRESQAFIINKESGIIAQSSFHPTKVI